ncbi:hypothetical protein BZA02_103247 [Ruegeria sp. P4]|nr:hypothetical protein BZA02_103247 [Ruegeria sp. P4]
MTNAAISGVTSSLHYGFGLRILAVFDYTGLIWAMLFDLLLFSHFPTPLSWLGIIAIAAAALFGAWRPKPVAV